MARSQKVHVAIPGDAPGTRETADMPRHLTKQEFGRRLYRLMTEKGLHHAELARRADLPRNNITTYVNGRSLPSQKSLDRLAKVLGVTPDELLPNRLELAIRGEQMPDMSMKSSVADPSRSWLTINREVSTAVAARIIGILEEARAEEVKRTGGK